METTTRTRYRRTANPIRQWRKAQISLLRGRYPELFDQLMDAGINRTSVLAAVSRNVQGKAPLPSAETIQHKRPALAAQREAAAMVLLHWRRPAGPLTVVARPPAPPGSLSPFRKPE
jgi:hypothetical protein